MYVSKTTWVGKKEENERDGKEANWASIYSSSPFRIYIKSQDVNSSICAWRCKIVTNEVGFYSVEIFKQPYVFDLYSQKDKLIHCMHVRQLVKNDEKQAY